MSAFLSRLLEGSEPGREASAVGAVKGESHAAPAPPLWEVEQRLIQLVCESEGLAPTAVTPQTRLIEDLNMDSLSIVEFFLEVEEVFKIEIPDALVGQAFTAQPATIRTVAQLVLRQWNSGAPVRDDWKRPREPLVAVEALPATQLGGALATPEWRVGRRYEPMGPNREGYPQYRRRTDGMRCVLLPEAEVWVGSDAPDAAPNQQPAHHVRVSAFLMDAEPVSNAAYARFLNSIGTISPEVVQEWCGVAPHDHRDKHYALRCRRRSWEPVAGTAQQPMILVSWYGANAYSLWANGLDWRYYHGNGNVARPLQDRPLEANAPGPTTLYSALPSEAQWEYAARGSQPHRYPWGDEPPTPDRVRVARHTTGADYVVDALPSAAVSACLGMSPFGLHHMAGNVWHWCRDWYDPDFFRHPAASQPDAQNTMPTGVRSERGGSWVGPAELAACSYRRARPPAARGRCLGFRCIGSSRDLPV